MSYSDTQVISKHALLEYDTFEDVYDTYFNRILNYVRCRTGSEENACDVTARIFERVFRNLHRYDAAKASLAPWLFSIASNELKKFYREQSRHKWLLFGEEQNVPADSASSPEDSILKQETYEQLFQALSCLKAREKNIVSLKFGGQLTNKEIAKVLGLSESNVGVLLYRSIQKLRKKLENNEVTL